MRRTLFFLIILSSAPLFAGNGGSTYTRYGLGDIRYFQSARSVGLGGTGAALFSNYSINRLNPAAWTLLSRTRYEIGAMYEGIFASDNAKSAFFGNMNFAGFMISFPVMPSRGITIAGGFIPYSNVNYEVVTTTTVEGLQFENRYLGEGGVSVANIGSSVRIGSDLNIGARINYYLGPLSYTTRQSFSGTSYTSPEVRRSMYLSGIGFTFGGIFTGLDKLLGLPASSSLDIGLLLTTGSDLKQTREKYYKFNNQVVLSYDTLIAEGEDIHIPYAIGGGISYTTEHYLIASDFYYQGWGGTSVPETPELQNAMRISLGTEFLPKKDPGTSPLRQTTYRAGLYYNSPYYKINGHSIDEYGITAGMGIPLFGEIRLDMGVDFSIRGTTSNHLQKDNIIRVTFSLAGGEPWFIRPVQE
ncbi:MAG: hypothetical protein L0213_10940 [Candidatus Dadabacteria bacterium]|nr:hypothetical protein [Candidatus Dadabacteria bacterium]